MNLTENGARKLARLLIANLIEQHIDEIVKAVSNGTLEIDGASIPTTWPQADKDKLRRHLNTIAREMKR